MIAFASAIEALRIANRVSMAELYQWTTISTDGRPIKASNGMIMQVMQSAAETKIIAGRDAPYDYAFVCSGLSVERHRDRVAESWLRVQDLQACKIGALCTGTYVLALAGLLREHKCVIHWENLSSFREKFPQIDVSSDLYEVDGRVLTCGGATASLDLMLYLIAEEHGHDLAWKVSEQCLLDRMRAPHTQQRLPLPARLGVQNKKIIATIEMMEATVNEPLSLPDLADRAGISRRQLERLFEEHVGKPPARYYLDLRLQRAQHLLTQSDLSIMDVAVSCGFVSGSHFSKSYNYMFGRSPREERSLAR